MLENFHVPNRSSWAGNTCSDQFTPDIAHPVRPEPGVRKNLVKDLDHPDTAQGKVPEPIAIIGMATKFPGTASDTESFWEMMLARKSALSRVPQDRYDADMFDCPSHGHFIQDDLGVFDAAFFTIPPTEAENMDPQQRWLLETTYHALENSGITLDQVSGSQTSVHVGCFTHDFEKLIQADSNLPGRHKIIGSSKSILANRVSWVYDLHGPSVVVDTACSSSLVALHQACQSLQSRDSNLGIVAGVNLIIDPTVSINLDNLGFLSPDGKCYSFDQRANGYSRGEGIGVIVIKPLDDALRDGDTIRAVIRATGSNQDGRTPGITQPSASAQEELIRSTYLKAGLSMADTQYFEAHGTGTPVGDPIEAHAISNAFKHQKRGPLYIGAVKSNIGHLEGASGIAGLIKTVLVLERGIIPANVWFDNVNPQIDAGQWNLIFPTETILWPNEGLRRASVNSFGFGGTNAHVILDNGHRHPLQHPSGNYSKQSTTAEVTPQPHGSDSNGSRTKETTQLLMLSAFDEAGVARLTSTLLQSHQRKLSSGAGTDLQDIAFTLNEKRNKLSWRSFAVATSKQDLSTLVWSTPVRATSNKRLCFVFTGQGAQWRHMGQELLRFKIFERGVNEAERHLASLGCYWSIREAIFMQHCPEDAYADINEARFSQPLCTVLQVALVDLLVSWGIRPDAVVGHSSGEIAAAYASGSISKQTAWNIAYYRGLAISETFKGRRDECSMMAIQTSPERLIPYLTPWNYSCNEGERITIACYNSFRNVTVSGPIRGLESLEPFLSRDRILYRRLQVDVAYHSPYMEHVAKTYEEYLGTCLASQQPEERPAFISTVTGTQIESDNLNTPLYWVKNLLNPVRFSDAMGTAFSLLGASPDGSTADVSQHVLEIGPHSALRSPLQDTLRDLNQDIKRSYSAVLIRNQDGLLTSLSCVGSLQCSGHHVDLSSINNELGSRLPPRMLSNLPSYPFNHTQKYWIKSRLERSLRSPIAGNHELLGAPALDWNELEARWNKRFLMDSQKFLSEHKVNGSKVYPAAGMIVMAIEAVRQLVPSSAAVTGYRMQNVTFPSALNLSDSSEGTETQFILRRGQAPADFPLSSWNEFRVCVLENSVWRECCRGSISVEYDGSMSTSFEINEHEVGMQASKRNLTAMNSDCCIAVDKNKMYECFDGMGLHYGPTFRGLDQIRVDDDGHATGTVDTQTWKFVYPDEKCKAHLIHPATLDAILQLALPALTGSGFERMPTIVPTLVKTLWISNTLNSIGERGPLSVCARSEKKGFRKVQSRLIAATASNGEIFLTGDASLTVIDSHHCIPSAETSRALWKVKYHPDIAMVDSATQLEGEGHEYLANYITNRRIRLNKKIFCLKTLERTLRGLPCSIPSSSSHLEQYVAWMKHTKFCSTARQLISEEVWQSNSTDLRDELSTIDAEGEILVKIADSLPKILEGKIDPLEFLFSDDLLERFYREEQWPVGMKDRVSTYIRAMAHKAPGLILLEVGAGTGAMTEVILDALLPDPKELLASKRFKQYFYTDISPGFFVQAKEKFQDPRVYFKTLDISKEPSSQGFELGTFDIVVASNALHATSNLETTLKHCRSLLKPGGKLLLHENMSPHDIITGFIFGLLPGWWNGQEDNRQLSPLLEQEAWHTLLRRTGFSGTELSLEGHHSFLNDDQPSLKVLISTATQAVLSRHIPVQKLPSVCVIYDRSSLDQCQICHYLEVQYSKLGILTLLAVENIVYLPETNLMGSVCIVLVGFDGFILQDLHDTTLSFLKKSCSQAAGIIWISGESNDPRCGPYHGLAKGLGHTIESENLDISFVTVTFEAPYDFARVSTQIIKVLTLNPCRTAEGYENDFIERNGVLHIPRLVEASEVTARTSSMSDEHQLLQRKWNEKSGKPLQLAIRNVGLLDTLTFKETNKNTFALDPDEAEVRVHAVGLNFNNVLTALGQLDDDYLGNELVGTVIGIGKGASTRLNVGDTVLGVHKGTMATTVRCKAYQLCKVPLNVPLLDAAGVPLVFCTAYYSLVSWARAQEGESILIHSGAGGVGQAAIQLSQILGLEIFTTTSSADKVQYLMDTYDIPRDHIFSSRSLDFALGVRRMTDGLGVDIVLNSLSGEALRKSWELLAPFGRFIELGKKDIHSTGISSLGGLPMQPFAKNVMFASVDLPSLYSTQDRISGILDAVVTLLAKGKIRPPSPVTRFKGSEIQQAFRLMQTGRHIGKLVIEFADNDLVDVTRSTKDQIFDANSSYVIAGGFGGIAKSICRWMVRKGARNIALLSRSKSRDRDSERLLDELSTRGITVVSLQCDISDIVQLQAALKRLDLALPPIKGCIQAAMVLDNASFNNMTSDSWLAAIRPKVSGSWNLHKLLPADMDFFVFLSSQAGLFGTHGQSNYAAGNVFQDELARKRTALGQKAISIDLGSVASIGYLANNSDIMSQALRQGIEEFSETELLSLLEYYCDPELPIQSDSRAQIITPVRLPYELESAGIAEPSWMSKPIFKHLHHVCASTNATIPTERPARRWKLILQEAKTWAEASNIVREALRKQLADLLAIEKDDVDVNKPAHSYGVDSLVAVELRNWFSKSIGADVAVFEILGNSTISILSQSVAQKSHFVTNVE